jgi:hypothetical protein
MRRWEIIADNLSKAGWSWGCVSALDAQGRTIWIADAIATTESVSLCVRMKVDGVLELERAICLRLWTEQI